ncbi:glycosyltransferase [Sabulilitoribacter multivorans]|uniref:Glycosyltransferase n=1 Tax=Flaviramulus multivorans TaxID=1304750 RepID=A0ABS9IHU3_9FLAO|nr:glycosyltransferase family 2 protein [Flaviramulus multivorans]MCF7560322.1 glycosyltransferase [Flaviramulus multivorans]
MKHKISIITVNYNNLEGLKKTIESVKSQTYQSFEYIVIDGCSNDGSSEFLEKNKELFDYWISEPDNGVYQAMNKGLKKATGEYLLFLNSGDHFISNKVLEENYRELIDASIIYFNLQVVENEKTFIKEYPSTLSFSYFVSDTLPHPATFIKKEVFSNTHLYREDFKIVSDWKFFMDAICKYNVTYKHINKPLSTFYIGGMSSNPENRIFKQNEKNIVLKEEYTAYIQDLDDVIAFRNTLNNLKSSRIIKILVKLGFLNKF